MTELEHPHLTQLGDDRKKIRADVEGKFAVKRQQIDQKYQDAVQNAESRRRNAHAKLVEEREQAMAKIGLNPDGSDPQDRPDGFYRTGDERLAELA